MQLSDRIECVEASKTAHFAALVSKMRGRGEDIVNLAIGEPHDPVSREIIAATQSALDAGHTKYCATSGLAELRREIARALPHHQADNVIITNGSKQALFSIFQVICSPGDEVIIPLPCWVSFPEQVKLAGGKPVMVKTGNHQLDLESVERAIGPRTRAILINSPNNPTGAVYPDRDLEKIGSLARERDLFIISDEAYSRFVYDDRVFTSLARFEELKNRVIVTGSFSKSFNMTGFRIGFAIGPGKVITAMTALQSHLSGNVCTFAQYGALEALRRHNGSGRQAATHFQKKRDTAFKMAKELFGCIRPAGAFYLFPDVTKVLESGQTAKEFTVTLLSDAKVAVMPGEAFGVENHIRISFAVPDDELIKGFERIRTVL